MQFFEWYLPNDSSLWKNVSQEAQKLGELGITALWLPPAYKSSEGINGVGYAVYDLYDLGEFDQKGSIPTKYGTKDQYLTAIEALHKNNLDNEVLYQYGLYVNSIAGSIKGIDKKQIANKFEKLPITNKHDINITSEEIMKILNRSGGSYLKNIYNDITTLILNNKLENNNDILKEYIVHNY